MKVLVINPGATSTKVAVFEEERELLKKSIIHTAQELEGFDRVIDQAELRQRAVLELSLIHISGSPSTPRTASAP